MELGRALAGLGSLCGLALTVVVVRAQWRAMGDARRSIRERRAAMPPEERRRETRNILLVLTCQLCALLAAIGLYAWGAHRWSVRTGAAMAVGWLLVWVLAAFVFLIITSVRDSRRETADRGRVA